MDTNILLESGTNELEVLEFKICGKSYGINVAKIKEILAMTDITPVPNSHPCIKGVFMPRDTVVTVIDLARFLGYGNGSDSKNKQLIVTNFNNLHIAFEVDMVVGIHRVSWLDMIKPDKTVNASDDGVAIGVIKKDTTLMIVLDYESIIGQISPETSLKMSEVESLGERERNNMPIIFAEDSPMLSRLVEDALHTAGYTSVTGCANGEEAWEKLKELKKNNGINYGVKCIITDIEMPQMDGHRLIRLIRADEAFDHVPIIIFSSLINDDMRRKGERLGADAQISKPEIGQLVGVIDNLIIQGRNVEKE